MRDGDRQAGRRDGQLAVVVRGLAGQTHDVVMVSAPPGYGLTTFLDHLSTDCRAAGWRVARASGSPVHQSMPYATIIDLLRDLTSSAPAAARLTHGIPELNWLVGGRRPAAALPRQTELERARLADAVRQVLIRAAATGRMLVVVDDLQDADDVSLDILRYVLTERPGARIPCVLGVREDRGSPPRPRATELREWVSRLRSGTRIDLAPLTRGEVGAQIATILGGPPPDSVSTLAYGLSGGSPGLVRLLVAELRRRGVLERRAGVWLLGPVDDLTVKADAEPLLASMLAGVDEVTRCAFELLTAGGGEVLAADLCRVCCRGPGMEAAVQVLADRGLVREELRADGHVVQTTVPLLVRVVAEAMRPQRHQELRLALSHAAGVHAQGDVELGTAQSLCQGSRLSDRQAYDLIRRGLDEALAARSWRQAVTLAETCIRRAATLATGDQLAELHEARARGLYAGGHRSDAVAAWRAAVAATPVSEVEVRAARLRELAEVEWQESLFTAASGHIEEAATLLSGDDVFVGAVRDSVTLTRGVFAGRAPLPNAAQLTAVEDLDDLWQRTGSPAAGVARLSVLATAAARDGRWIQMLALARQACHLASTSGDPHLVGQAASALETAQVVAIDVQARGDIDAAIAAASEAGLESVEADHRSLAAFFAIVTGDIAAGLAHAEAILAIGSRLGSRAVLAKGFLVRGLIHAHVGNVSLALACRDEFLGCYDSGNAGLLHLNVGAGELDAHIALRQGRLTDVLSALGAFGSPRRGHWFHATMLAGTAQVGLHDADALGRQMAALRALPEPVPWVDAVVNRLEGLQALLTGRLDICEALLRASSARLEDLGLALPAALGWLEWAEVGLAGQLDAEAAARVEAVTASLTRMGATEAAERGRRLLRGPRRHPGSVGAAGQLTDREMDVARLVAEGLSNPEIADRLYVSTRTVTTHLTHIYRRLGLSGRTALAHYIHTRTTETLGA